VDDLDHAAALFEGGQLAEAAHSLSRIIQQSPANARALGLLGKVAAAAGDHARARELFAASERAAGLPPGGQMSDILASSFPGVTFGQDVQCIGVSGTRIGQGTCVGDGTWFNLALRDKTVRMVVGECVLVGRRNSFSSGTYLEIGSFTICAPNVFVASTEHQIEGNHLKPMLHSGIVDHGRLVIEENCWLGVNAVVVGGFTVGRGSVVGANAVLRQSLPPFCVAVGAPARIVKMYNPATQEWQAVKTEADQLRIMDARTKHPLPSREELLAQLKTANQGRPVSPILAGRGEHLV
jgi:acetyltransferase-like isoleucine patch superfamily enzyme